MQRPVMNPMFLQEEHPPQQRSAWSRIVTKLGHFLFRLALLELAVVPRKQNQDTISHPAVEMLRGLIHRSAVAVGLVCMVVLASVYFATRQNALPPAADPSSIGLYFEDIPLKAQDGVVSSGWFVPVVDARRVLDQGSTVLTSKYPAVVLVPDSGFSRSQLMSLVPDLHEADVIVMVLAPRGRETASPASQTFGLRESLDIKAALAFLSTRNDVDTNRIGLVGAGTGASAALITANPDMIKSAIPAPSQPSPGVLVLLGPPTDAQDVVKKYLAPSTPLLSWTAPLCKWSFEWCYGYDLDQIDLLRHSALMRQRHTHFTEDVVSASLSPRLHAQVIDFLVLALGAKSARLQSVNPPVPLRDILPDNTLPGSTPFYTPPARQRQITDHTLGG